MNRHIEDLSARTAAALGTGFTVLIEPHGLAYAEHEAGARAVLSGVHRDNRRTVTDDEVSELTERLATRFRGSAKDPRYTPKAREQALVAVEALRVEVDA